MFGEGAAEQFAMERAVIGEGHVPAGRGVIGSVFHDETREREMVERSRRQTVPQIFIDDLDLVQAELVLELASKLLGDLAEPRLGASPAIVAPTASSTVNKTNPPVPRREMRPSGPRRPTTPSGRTPSCPG